VILLSHELCVNLGPAKYKEEQMTRLTNEVFSFYCAFRNTDAERYDRIRVSINIILLTLYEGQRSNKIFVLPSYILKQKFIPVLPL
jgi:hypothetical protein